MTGTTELVTYIYTLCFLSLYHPMLTLNSHSLTCYNYHILILKYSNLINWEEISVLTVNIYGCCSFHNDPFKQSQIPQGNSSGSKGERKKLNPSFKKVGSLFPFPSLLHSHNYQINRCLNAQGGADCIPLTVFCLVKTLA